jgi:hypothetical protein
MLVGLSPLIHLSLTCIEFVIFGSQRISLIKRSRFCSYYIYLFIYRWGSSSFRRRWRGLTVKNLDRLVLNSLLRLVSVGHPRRPLSSRMKSVCLSWETGASTKTLMIIWSIFWASFFINSNTWHLICNNFNLILYMVLYAYMCVFVHSRFVKNLPIWS